MDNTDTRAAGGDLVSRVSGMADADDELAEDAKLLVLAALDGDTDLADALEGGYTAPERAEEPSEETATEPAGVFVRSIHTRGFRGIGPAAKLELQPAPGLTIVAGRNGSGKSSFSEALEMALTDDTYRWNKQHTKQAAVWAEHWRNLHDGDPCEIRVELAEEGQGTTTVGVDWTKRQGLREHTTWVQRPGRPRENGISSLGWDRAIELHKPILSYDELGGLLEAGPSKLFDKLDALLGIEQATDAEQRLASAAKELKHSDTQARTEGRELKKVLGTVDDERASRVLSHLRKHRPDLDAVEAITTGTSSESAGELAPLRALAQLELPSEQAVIEAANDLRHAADRMLGLSTSSVDLAARRTELLRKALELHEHHGDGPCPVCGQGTLNSAWRQQVEEAVSAEDDEIQQHTEAKRRLERARQAAHQLVQAVLEPAQPGRFELDSFTDAHNLWQWWARLPDSDTALAEHLESVSGQLRTAFALLREEAAGMLGAREDTWAPHATRLAAWVGKVREAREMEPRVRLVESAHQFTKRVVEQLRNEQLAELKGTAREVWSALKQESNVDLGEIELKGSGNRRHVELYADVDGTDAQALGVMSQGELHALAMALFLPRATVSGSPFRFVVLDDPVQAMDPAKIDGFARILAEFARDRQVVVFSHDDRLPQTVRQLGIDARILEVSREDNSEVSIVPCSNPARRALDDARAVANDDEVPPDVKARVMAGLCRSAVEAAALDAYMARRFAAGAARVEVEDTWQNASKTSRKLALAVHDDNAADLSAWLDSKPWRRPAHTVVTKAAHEPLRKNPRAAVDEVERLVGDLEAMRR